MSPSACNPTRTAPRVTLVGAGPGDPDLLTLKAVKALRQATVVLMDDLVSDGVLRFVRRSARIIPVGKRGGCASTPQAYIERLMIKEARAGERVVRLKGGDPFVFGRGGEECEALRAAGIEVAVVSGLTAGIAGPASIGIPVTDRRYCRGVALVTGHSGTGASLGAAGKWIETSGSAGAASGGPGAEPDWAALARCGLTLVVYMGVARLADMVQGLLQGGLPASTPAAVISAAHTPQQRQALCSLGSLQTTALREKLCSPAIVVLGDVVQAAALLPLQAECDAAGNRPQPVAA